MRTSRQSRIDRALARVLTQAEPYLVPVVALREETADRVTPRPTATEVEDSLRFFDAAGRLTSIPGDTGPSYKLNAIGQAWAAENL